jgi:hypothetical protein
MTELLVKMIKRKNRIASTDGPLSCNTKTQCQSCYNNETITELVEYKPDPIHFMTCPFCKTIVKKSNLRFQSVYGPLGDNTGKKPTFDTAITRRRISKYNDNNDVFRVEDYPMLPDGTEDSDLTHYANSGIIVSITDEVGSQGEAY